MKKIAVLVSGGVDSSVALALLKEQGHDVTAFYLKIWLEDELSYLGECPWEQDLEFARGVCDKLGVPLKIVSMQHVYHDHVVSYMLAEIKAGRTPNPDLLCNQQVKFGAFYKAIDESGETFDYVATGHYAQVEHPTILSSSNLLPALSSSNLLPTLSSSNLIRGSIQKDGQSVGLSILKKGNDPVKDQTYFLAYLSQQQLSRALFPIGAYPKAQVRELAKRFDLPTQSRKDSMGICFLGKFNFTDFLKAHFGTKQGDIVQYETKDKLGTHNGYWFHTIGQRQGLGLSGGPWYVVSKDMDSNIVYVSRDYDQIHESKSGMIVRDFNWISGTPTTKTELDVRFRHGPKLHPAVVVTEGSDRVRIMLKTESGQGIAAGQFAVLYNSDICLGGGIIEQAL